MDPQAYGQLEAEDRIEGVEDIRPEENLKMVVKWVMAGSALNHIKFLEKQVKKISNAKS